MLVIDMINIYILDNLEMELLSLNYAQFDSQLFFRAEKFKQSPLRLRQYFH